MEQCPYANHVACVPFLFLLMGTFMSNSSGLWASGDLLMYLWGGTTQGGAIVVLFLVVVFEGMIQLVDKM